MLVVPISILGVAVTYREEIRSSFFPDSSISPPERQKLLQDLAQLADLKDVPVYAGHQVKVVVHNWVHDKGNENEEDQEDVAQSPSDTG